MTRAATYGFSGEGVFHALERSLAFEQGLFHVLVLGGSVAHDLAVLPYRA